MLGLGGARVASGAIDVGALIAFLLYLYYLLPPMQGLVGAATQYQVGAAAVARIRQAEQLPVEPDRTPAKPPRPGAASATVAFDQVHFRYRPELPEATSQLDAVNEAALRDTIADAARTTTVLVVAHRLSTVTMADRIVVIDAGRVRAVGTHTDLLGTDPLYAELAATQFLVAAD